MIKSASNYAHMLPVAGCRGGMKILQCAVLPAHNTTVSDSI